MLVFVALIVVQFLFLHITCQQAASESSSMIITFFGQTATILLVGTDMGEIIRPFFYFEFTSSASNTPTIEYCPFERNSYIRLLTEILTPTIMIALLVLMLACTRVTYYIVLGLQTLKRLLSSESTAEQATVDTDDDMTSANYDDLEDDEAELARQEAIKSRKRSGSKIVQKVVSLSKSIYNFVKTTFVDPYAYVCSFIKLLQTTFQVFIVAGIAYFTCKELDGQYFMVSASDIMCYVAPWTHWMVIYLGAAIYAILFPLLILLILTIGHCKGWMYDPTSRFYRIFANFFVIYRLLSSTRTSIVYV